MLLRSPVDSLEISSMGGLCRGSNILFSLGVDLTLIGVDEDVLALLSDGFLVVAKAANQISVRFL
jgi:voltage-gated potassium channel Kch